MNNIAKTAFSSDLAKARRLFDLFMIFNYWEKAFSED